LLLVRLAIVAPFLVMWMRLSTARRTSADTVADAGGKRVISQK